MKFVPTKDEFGEQAALLDISDLDMEIDEEQSKFLTFSLKKYINLSANKQDPDTSEFKWNVTFYLVNQFFSTLNKEIQEKIAKTFILIHKNVADFSVKKASEREEHPETFVVNQGKNIVQLDKEIDLRNHLVKFVEAGYVDLEDQSRKGRRPQDHRKITWNNEDLKHLTACIILSKMCCPCFSVIMLYFSDLDGFEFDTDIQQLYVSQLVIPLLNEREPNLLLKLEQYVEYNYNADSRQQTRRIMSGMTTYSTIHTIVNNILVRPFVNINLGEPSRNPMHYIHTVTSRASSMSQGKEEPFSTRDPNKFMDEEDNTSTLEWDSAATDRTMDVPLIATTFAPKIANQVAANYGISQKELNECIKFYKSSPFPVSFLSHSLTAGFFGPRLGGGKAVSHLNYEKFVHLVSVVQLICIIDQLHLLGHMLTAHHGVRERTHYSPEETQLKFLTDVSYPYKNCALRYMYLGENVWHHAIKEYIIENVLSVNYYYNTTPVIWNHMSQDLNGEPINIDRTLAKQISTFIETHI